MNYTPSVGRYQSMKYSRCGKSGLRLPAISLGFWHHFGAADNFDNATRLITRAFDLGITHFDLASNYGPPPGAAETTLGKVLGKQLAAYRDELVISSKAGYHGWEGPYGQGSSKKSLLASIDRSLTRMGLDYVDIFYSHRYDPHAPLEETMMALDQMVRQGKALYVGISNYDPEQTQQAVSLLGQLGTPVCVHQLKYSMFERSPEKELLPLLEENGVGCIPFSPLAQGLLTDKYLAGIPQNSRVARQRTLKPETLTTAMLDKAARLNQLARQRSQSLAQMALAWILRDERISSVLVGSGSAEQLEDCVACLEKMAFTSEELSLIDTILEQDTIQDTLPE